MTNELEERLSALLDGELDDSEIRSCLDQIEENDELAQRWQRYHLIGDAMRSNMPERFDVDLAGHVRSAIAEEPTLLAPKRKPTSQRHALRYATGAALAASVAAVALIAIQPNMTESTAPTAVAMQAPQTVVAANSPAKIMTVRTVTPPAQAAITPYLINHNEYAGRHGMLPYVRIVNERVGQ